MLERAFAAGVSFVMAVGGGETLNAGAAAAKRIAASRPGALPAVFSAAGLDRDCAGQDVPAPDFASADAVGEIGLDYHYEPSTRREQLDLFLSQLDVASRLGKSVIIHTRDADADTLGALREIPSKGVIHCFTGSPQFCRELLDLGFFISISGIVTFKAADNVRESALYVPGDRLMIETDSPYLAPVPMRGNANEPAFIVHTLRFLASLRGVSPESLAESTVRNAFRAFGIAQEGLQA